MNDNVPFWRFWNPRSGALGGLIFGLVLVAAYCIVANLIA